MPHAIALIGCGHMGGALLEGWLKGGVDATYTVLKPHGLPEKFQNRNITHISAPDAALSKADIVILAVKPQILATVLERIREYIDPKALILSVAAGWSLERLGGYFSQDRAIIRTLPNLPAAIGKGMTLAIANQHADAASKNIATDLLQCAGAVEWLAEENLMNAASMISGAGPAFPFYLVEVMAQAGINNGVPADLAMRLARQTVIGAAALLESTPDKSVADFRKGVTSAGGVTEAALQILMNGEMQKLFDAALAAGAKRGEALNG